MKALVLGGTGAMGVHIVRILSERGYEVTVTSRRHHEDEENVKYLCGNAHETEFLQPILEKGWDVIVDFMIYSPEGFKEKMPLFLSNTEQYVFLSSASLFADAGENLIKEDSPRLLDINVDKRLIKSNIYPIAKARQENMLRSSRHTNYTIVRPYVTYSENRLQLGTFEKEMWVYQTMHGLSLVFFNDIASKYTTLTYGKDVSRAMAGLIGNSKALGEDFNLVTNEYHTWREIAELYQSHLSIILGRAINIRWFDNALESFYGDYAPQVQFDRLYNRRFDNSKILSVVPNMTFTDCATGIKHCLDAFVSNPVYKKEMGFGAIGNMCRLTHESLPLSEIPDWKNRMKYFVRRYISTNK